MPLANKSVLLHFLFRAPTLDGHASFRFPANLKFFQAVHAEQTDFCVWQASSGGVEIRGRYSTTMRCPATLAGRAGNNSARVESEERQMSTSNQSPPNCLHMIDIHSIF